MRKLGFLITATLIASCAPAPDQVAATPGQAMTAPEPGKATSFTQAANQKVANRLPIADTADREDATRNRLAYITDEAILSADGRVVWPVPQFDFLEGEAPDTVNPSLWRQSQLAAHHGLFEVTEGVYQVRGYDLSVMTVIAGDAGWIIVDPLTTTETAAASLELVNDTLGARPVTGVLYTHSHADHFGGARGVISEEDIANRNVPVLAPIGFSQSAVSENLIAGNHMSRRSTLMFGNTIPRSTTAHVGSGLGPGLPNGTISLVLPTEEISGRGTRREIDGVTFEFIDAAGTEAPAEFMFYLPEKRALCTAEVATATFHNVLTPRGAKVRDALEWSRVIDYTLAKYGDKSDVVFASHHWPTWGNENVQTFLAGQRDIYRYVHDQTLRQANAGATMVEAAEAIEEPAFQSSAFDVRGYYGTMNHNSKAVYQNYFGWWGGVPAEYNRLPSEAAAPRYVEAMGGAAAAIDIGVKAFESGEYRWAAEVFNHVVFADPDNAQAKDWLAASYEQLGFQAESGAWRSYYLTGSAELRRGLPTLGNPTLGNKDFLKAVPSRDLFDAMAARYNPERMTRDPFIVNFAFTDTGEALSLHVNKAVMVPREAGDPNAVASVTVSRELFDQIILGETNMAKAIASGAFKIEGEAGSVAALFGSLDQPAFWFNVVTP
jgi:alkyl sulfatase BDS1-like metallo-beta-lactamase superfamily hydrolase